ncbi:MAG TPA: STAS domain-containing protein [Ilumatobacteraceae bacterium]|nr:STAS domain-containing protein [Ilumatobacteraceae bacterium]
MPTDERNADLDAESTWNLQQPGALPNGRDETTTADRLLIIVNHFDGVAVLALRGEIDAHNANCLRDSVAAVCELGVPVALDMDQVTFMDCAGIGALIAASRFTLELSSSLRITRPSRQVRRILSLTGLDEVLLVEAGTRTSR